MNETIIKSATEIGMLAAKLNPNFQAYVLSTINAFIYSQQIYSQERAAKFAIPRNKEADLSVETEDDFN